MHRRIRCLRTLNFHARAVPGAQGDVRPYAKFMVDTVRSNKDAAAPDVLLKVRGAPALACNSYY